MIRFLACLCILLILSVGALRADETVRQVQEELRKRNLYFGDIDGQNTPAVTSAVKRYQKRKGFAVTGTVDPDTAASLHMQATAASSNVGPTVSSQVPSTASLTEKGPSGLDLPQDPEPPAESPAPSQDITQDRVNKFVEAYLRDAETNDIYLQAWFYAFPVDYFHHGSLDQRSLIKDLHYHVKDWPERKYTLTAPPSFVASGNEGEINIEFSIAYTRRNKKRSTSGKAKYTWKVRAEGEELRIVSIREQLLPNRK